MGLRHRYVRFHKQDVHIDCHIKKPRSLNRLCHCMRTWDSAGRLYCLSSPTPLRCVGDWRYSSAVPDLDTRWRRVVASRPCRFNTLEKCFRYLLYRRVGGFQSQSGLYGEEKNLTHTGMTHIGPLWYQRNWPSQLAEQAVRLCFFLLQRRPLDWRLCFFFLLQRRPLDWRLCFFLLQREPLDWRLCFFLLQRRPLDWVWNSVTAGLFLSRQQRLTILVISSLPKLPRHVAANIYQNDAILDRVETISMTGRILHADSETRGDFSTESDFCLFDLLS